MLYLRIEGTGVRTLADVPFELADVCEAMHDLSTDAIISMEIREGNLNKVLAVLDRKFARASNRESFAVAQTDGDVLTIRKVQAPAPAVQEAPPPPRAPEAMVRERAEERVERVLEDTRAANTAMAPRTPPPAAPQHRTPQCVARTNETLNIADIADVNGRVEIAAADIGRHLYSLKSDNAGEKVDRRVELLSEYQEIIAQLASIKREIDDISKETVDDAAVKQVLDDVARLRRDMPGNKIEEIFFTGRYMVIQTTPIIATDSTNGNRHRIGRLQFIISLSSIMSYRRNEAAFYVQNIDNVIRYDGNTGRFTWAPHTDSHGSCFGNAGELIVEAIAKRDIMSLCDILIRFYENPNMGDQMGLAVRHFPRVEENANV